MLIRLVLTLASLAYAGDFRPRTIDCNITAISAGAGLVRTVDVAAGKYQVNGLPAADLGFGNSKDVVMHPQNPDLVVKVFHGRYLESIPEKRLEQSQIALLAPARLTPRLVEQGALMVGGKPTGYIVQEKVSGLTLERPTASKLAEVRKLFDKLVAARLEVVDGALPAKMRQNIMVGETKSDGWGAYLVDPDVVKSQRSEKELRAFYDGVYNGIVSGR